MTESPRPAIETRYAQMFPALHPGEIGPVAPVRRDARLRRGRASGGERRTSARAGRGDRQRRSIPAPCDGGTRPVRGRIGPLLGLAGRGEAAAKRWPWWAPETPPARRLVGKAFISRTMAISGLLNCNLEIPERFVSSPATSTGVSYLQAHVSAGARKFIAVRPSGACIRQQALSPSELRAPK
jgi:hypothetical protein